MDTSPVPSTAQRDFEVDVTKGYAEPISSVKHPDQPRHHDVVNDGDHHHHHRHPHFPKLETARSHLGLLPAPPVNDEHSIATVQQQSLLIPRIRMVLREPFAEFFGVFIMVLFGNGSVAQVVLSAGQATAPGKDGFGPYQSISWG